jgi:membrane fusion protein, multidrug efflux system
MTPLRLGALLLIGLNLAGCDSDTPLPVPPRPVLTTTITPISTETFGPFLGTVEPRYQTQLGFQTSGRMIERDVNVGDLVRKGQRLAALEETIAQFGLARAEADVNDAQAQFAYAQGILNRQKILVTNDNAPQVAMDNATAQLETAEARVDQAKAALIVAEKQIGYTVLTANFDGVVTSWSAEVGQYVSIGQAVVTIARPDVREAVVDIPDDLIGSITPGMEFTARLQASPEISCESRVREIDPLADPITRAHRVLLTLEGPGSAFRLGTTVTIAREQAIPPKILVPAAAVLSDSNGEYVWILAENGLTVTRRKIRVTGTEGDNIIVRSGLAAGDRIVIVGVHSLRDGQAVAGEAGSATKSKGPEQ